MLTIDITEDKRFLYLMTPFVQELNLVKSAFVREIKNAWFLKKKSKFIETKRAFVTDLGYMPIGLWLDLLKYCQENNIQCNFTQRCSDYISSFNTLKKDDIVSYINELFDGAVNEKGKQFSPRGYQIDAIYTLLKYRMSTAEISTSSGKTLIAYVIFKYLIEKCNIKKILYIVPSIDLAEQSAEKYKEYESFLKNPNNDWTTGILIGGISKKQQKINETCNILFATFQSLKNKDKMFFKQFDACINDECHHISGSSVQKILAQCVNLKYSIGVTGTYPKYNTIENLTLKSYIGPQVYTLTSDSLINEEKSATPIYIVFQMMNWATEDEKNMLWEARNIKSSGASNIDYSVGTKLLRHEQKFVNSSGKRLKYVADLAIKMKNNTLILFGDIKGGYGKRIYQYIKDYSDKVVFYIDGSTSSDMREYYKQQCEEDTSGNTILVASIGTFGEGIDISNIWSIFLINSAKSERLIRQICGRGLRLYPGKDKTVLYDFVDDLRYSKTGRYTDNYLWTHYKERKKIYKEQNFPVFEQDINLQEEVYGFN